MKVNKLLYDRRKGVLQANLWSCRHYSKDVFTNSELFSRTNLTNKAKPRTPSPTLKLIKMNKNLKELFSCLSIEAINNPNRENISRVINREIKWLFSLLKDQSRINNHNNTKPLISTSRKIRVKNLLLNKIILVLKLKFMRGVWF